MKKMLSILMIVAILVFSVNMVFAENLSSSDLPTGGTNQLSGAEGKISSILGTVRWIGIVIAIGWLMYLGIKYVMASADEKASLKGGMMKMVIGVVILLGASVIVGWIANVIPS